MTNRAARMLWILAAGASGVMTVLAQPDNLWLIPVAVVVVVVTLFGQLSARGRQIVGAPVHWLRGRPVLYWLALLVVFSGGLGAWVVNYQPTNGRWLLPVEFGYLAALVWLLLYLLFFDATTAQAREMGGVLSRSRLTGALVTLTTILLLFIAGETWMRLFYITTDSYGFTAMNYHWYKNFYWGHYNSVGYRDYEPIPDAETRIAVLGDSFAMGHGINNIDETFPQLLERELGAGYDVNVVAQSGWDTDVELYNLDSYPYRPNIVILSYYLNDIDYLLKDPAVNPDSHFTFPDNPVLSWFVLNFFVPNYIYYNLLQFTSPTRNSNFLNDLVNAHLNDQYWGQQMQRLSEIVVWTERHDTRLIVLLWPHIAARAESRPATDRVKAFFVDQGITVVDMGEVLGDRSAAQLIVNRFDAHPGVEAQRLAADALYTALQH